VLSGKDSIAPVSLPDKARMGPTAAILLADVSDAVAEIERVFNLGIRALLLPEIPPEPYWSKNYEPVWACAEAHGLPIFMHVATGGVKVKEDSSVTGSTVKGLMTAMNMGKGNLTDDMVAGRTMGGGNTTKASPQKIIADLIGGGVCERHPNLHFNLIEFGASWLVSYLAFMDKSWRMGTGQDPNWWLGFWDDSRSPYDQPTMGRLFNINAKWPYPLKPTEYVRRQIHVQFADDPVAVQARHITGLTTIMWGNDYPHAEGTFRSTEEAINENIDSTVSDEDRAAILGGTLAKVAYFDTSKKPAVSQLLLTPRVSLTLLTPESRPATARGPGIRVRVGGTGPWPGLAGVLDSGCSPLAETGEHLVLPGEVELHRLAVLLALEPFVGLLHGGRERIGRAEADVVEEPVDREDRARVPVVDVGAQALSMRPA
jgi:predicted TIM-barrel fold metal-dependent hydrolase